MTNAQSATNHDDHKNGEHTPPMEENSHGESVQADADGKLSPWTMIGRCVAFGFTAIVFVWMVFHAGSLDSQTLPNGHSKPENVAAAKQMYAALWGVGIIYVVVAFFVVKGWNKRSWTIGLIWLIVCAVMIVSAAYCNIHLVGPLTQLYIQHQR